MQDVEVLQAEHTSVAIPRRFLPPSAKEYLASLIVCMAIIGSV
jgi:hypothetical protein